MSMDTPSGESNASISVNDAAALFGAPPEPEQKPEAQATEPAEVEPAKVPEATQAEAEDTQASEEDTPAVEMVEVDIDGFKVKIPKDKAETLEKQRLLQADYTRKRMAEAEIAKAAKAETEKAREERTKYAQGLQQAHTLLQAQLQEQSRIDWHQLRETDPNEFLKQWHLYSERQANMQKVLAEQQQLSAREEAEQAEQIKAFVKEQQEQLIAKLPEWKDQAKAKAETAAIREYLKTQGLEAAQIDNITDHRVVVLSRKAMLYDQMMSKASAAAKKVSNLPQKVEKPGGGEVNTMDGRTQAMKALQKSGSVHDAAKLFALLK
jgi:hypothetical protein